MPTIGDLKVKLGLNSSEFTSGLQQAKSQTAGLGTSLAGVGRQASALGQVMSTAIGTAGGFLVAQTVMRGVGAAVGFARSAFLDYNSTLEQAQIGFTTLLGSAEKAQGFLKQLQDFANTTPFEMPGLLKATTTLKGYGFAAEELIPILTDVGNVASAMGRGQEGIDRITLALGQMNAATVVHTMDLNQLIQVGVPVWDILAKATGKSGDALKKLVEQGQISSDFFIKAFDEWSQQYKGMLDAQSHSFAGAMSNISDNARGAVAQGLRPFFTEISNLANRLGEFVASDRFKTWVAQVQLMSERAVAAIRAIAREFQAGGVSAGVRAILTEFDRLAGGMFGAGWNLIATYASGVAGAANSILRGIIDGVSSLIASFFIGHSPPPEGPLAQIDEGGRTLMETYGAGMAEGLAPVRQTADAVAGIFAQMDRSMSLETARRAAQDAAGNLEAMQAAGEAVDDQLRQIDHTADELDQTIAALRRQIEDVTDAYQAQIDPLQAQIDALTRARDLEQERQDLNLRLQDIQLQEATLAAEGDPAKRAELASQLALLKAQQEQHDLERQILDIERQLAQAPLKAQQDALKLTEEQQKLDERAAALRKDRAAGKDTAAAERQLAIDREQLGLKQQQAALDTGPDLVGLNLKLAQLKAQQDLNGLADRGKLAELEGQRALLDARQQSNDLAERELQTTHQIAALPLEAQLAALKAQQADALAPLNDQLKLYQRQSDLLGEQRRQWQNLKSDIADAVQPLKQAESDAKAAAKKTKGEAGPSIALAPGEARLPTKPIELFNQEDIDRKKEELKKRGQDIGRQLGEGIKSYLKDNIGALVGGGIGSAIGGMVLGPAGALIGGLLGKQIGDQVQEKIGSINLSRVASIFDVGKMGNAHALDGVDMSPLEQVAFKAGNLFAEVQPKLQELVGFIRETAIPAIAEFLPKMAAFIRDDVLPRLGDLLGTIRDDVIPAVKQFASDAKTFIQTDVIPVLESLWGWFEHSIIPALKTTATNIREDVLPPIQSIADLIKDKLFPAAESFAKLVWPDLKAVFGFLVDHEDLIVGVGVAWAAFVATTQLFAAIKGVQEIFAAMSMGIKGVNLSLLAPPGIALLIAAIGFAIFEVWQHWDQIGPQLEAGWNWMKKAAGDLYESVSGFFSDLWSSITGTVSSLWSWLKEHWQEIVTGVLAIVFPPGAGLFLLVTHFGEIRDKVGEIVDTVKTKVSGVFDSIKTTVTGSFSDAKTWLVDAGSDILRGLWDGMQQVWGWFKRQWNDLLDKIPGGLADKFKISSPSRVFAELGGFITAGLALGIQQGGAAPRTAMLAVSRDVLQAATITPGRVTRPLGAGGRLAGAGPGNGQPLVIHNYLFPNAEKLNTTIYEADARRASRTY